MSARDNRAAVRGARSDAVDEAKRAEERYQQNLRDSREFENNFTASIAGPGTEPKKSSTGWFGRGGKKRHSRSSRRGSRKSRRSSRRSVRRGSRRGIRRGSRRR